MYKYECGRWPFPPTYALERLALCDSPGTQWLVDKQIQLLPIWHLSLGLSLLGHPRSEAREGLK